MSSTDTPSDAEDGMARTWLARTMVSMAVGALVLTGCSGGDDTSSSEPVVTTDTATDVPTGDGDVGIFDATECADAVAAWSSAAASAGAALSGGDDLGSSLDQLQAFAESAPEEIREDLTIVYQAYGEFAAALEASGYDPASGAAPTADQIAALEAASEALADADVQGASDRVGAWFQENCPA
jgi:hypothetical protein